MLSLPSSVRIFAAREAVDFRKGFDGLTAVVRDGFQDDPFAGLYFLFFNRRRDRVKGLRSPAWSAGDAGRSCGARAPVAGATPRDPRRVTYAPRRGSRAFRGGGPSGPQAALSSPIACSNHPLFCGVRGKLRKWVAWLKQCRWASSSEARGCRFSSDRTSVQPPRSCAVFSRSGATSPDRAGPRTAGLMSAVVTVSSTRSALTGSPSPSRSRWGGRGRVGP